MNDPKFGIGAVVYNSATREHGQVKRSYEKSGVVMYEVTVPANRNTWVQGFYTSDWEESRLELSSNEPLWIK
jgi:hypothetical protein